MKMDAFGSAVVTVFAAAAALALVVIIRAVAGGPAGHPLRPACPAGG